MFSVPRLVLALSWLLCYQTSFGLEVTINPLGITVHWDRFSRNGVPAAPYSGRNGGLEELAKFYRVRYERLIAPNLPEWISNATSWAEETNEPYNRFRMHFSFCEDDTFRVFMVGERDSTLSENDSRWSRISSTKFPVLSSTECIGVSDFNPPNLKKILKIDLPLAIMSKFGAIYLDIFKASHEYELAVWLGHISSANFSPRDTFPNFEDEKQPSLKARGEQKHKVRSAAWSQVPLLIQAMRWYKAWKFTRVDSLILDAELYRLFSAIAGPNYDISNDLKNSIRRIFDTTVAIEPHGPETMKPKTSVEASTEIDSTSLPFKKHGMLSTNPVSLITLKESINSIQTQTLEGQRQQDLCELVNSLKQKIIVEGFYRPLPQVECKKLISKAARHLFISVGLGLEQSITLNQYQLSILFGVFANPGRYKERSRSDFAVDIVHFAQSVLENPELSEADAVIVNTVALLSTPLWLVQDHFFAQWRVMSRLLMAYQNQGHPELKRELDNLVQLTQLRSGPIRLDQRTAEVVLNAFPHR